MDTYFPEPIYREDSLVNQATGVGLSKYDPSQSWDISWQNIRTLNRYQQSALASIGLMHRIIYTLPNACCRKWGTVTLDGGSQDDIESINKALINIPVIDSRRRRGGGGFRSAIRMALGLAFKTGNGAVILDADDGRPLYEPLDLNNLRKIKSIRVASKWQVVPYFFHNDGPSYSHYQVFAQGFYTQGDVFNMSGTIIHRSRVFWFTGIEEDDEFIGNRYSLPGTDRSILDLVVEAFLEYYGGIKGAGRMIQDFDVIVHKIKGLAEMLQADCDGATSNAKSMVANSAAMNAKTRSAFRSYVADMDQEAIEHITRQVGGYDGLLQTIKTYLLINAPYPPAVLFGEFSAGLGASGESQEEHALWNDTVSQEQEAKISPNMISLDPEFIGILGVVMAQQEGPTKGEILDNVGWKWNKLFEPTTQQQAALEKDRAVIIQTLGAIDKRFVPNAILSHYGGQEYQDTITLTEEYKAALEAEARLEQEPPGDESEKPGPIDDDDTELSPADGGTEDDVDLTQFAEFIDFDKTDSWGTDELFPHLDAKKKSKLQVGDTKTKNGKTYVFNENRRWALERKGGSKPKAKSKASSKAKKKGPQPGDTKQSKSGKTMVFNGETRRWRLQKPEDVKQAKAELKKAVEDKGAKLTPAEARDVIESPKELTSDSRQRTDELDKQRSLLVDAVGVELVEQAEANAQRILNESSQYIMVPDTILDKVVQDGFKGQIELFEKEFDKAKNAFDFEEALSDPLSDGTRDDIEWEIGEEIGKGIDYINSRKQVEQSMFAGEFKKDGTDRPIYGYIGSDNPDGVTHKGPRNYGNISLKLKPDVKNRSTVAKDDSWVGHTPSSLSRLNVASFIGEAKDARFTGEIGSPAKAKAELEQLANARDIDSLVKDMQVMFLEFQAHEGVKASDISEIVTFENAPISAKAKKWADANGVTIRKG